MTLAIPHRSECSILDVVVAFGSWKLQCNGQLVFYYFLLDRTVTYEINFFQDSTFVGLDMKDIQPHFDVLADATEEYATVAPRIKWVHQNL
jgi:hypothetical protein